MISLNHIKVLKYLAIGLLFIANTVGFYATDSKLDITKIEKSLVKTFVQAIETDLAESTPFAEMVKQHNNGDLWMAIDEKTVTKIAAYNLVQSFQVYKAPYKKNFKHLTRIDGQVAPSLLKMDDSLFNDYIVLTDNLANRYYDNYSVVDQALKARISGVDSVKAQSKHLKDYINLLMPAGKNEVQNFVDKFSSTQLGDAFKNLFKFGIKVDFTITGSDKLKEQIDLNLTQDSNYLSNSTNKALLQLVSTLSDSNAAGHNQLNQWINKTVNYHLTQITNELKNYLKIDSEVTGGTARNRQNREKEEAQMANEKNIAEQKGINAIDVNHTTTLTEKERNIQVNLVKTLAKLLVVDTINHSPLANGHPLFEVGLSKSFRVYTVTPEDVKIVIRPYGLDYEHSILEVTTCTNELDDIASPVVPTVSKYPYVYDNKDLPQAISVDSKVLESSLKTTLELKPTDQVKISKIAEKTIPDPTPDENNIMSTNLISVRNFVVSKVADSFNSIQKNIPATTFFEETLKSELQTTVTNQQDPANPTIETTIEKMSDFILALQGTLAAKDLKVRDEINIKRFCYQRRLYDIIRADHYGEIQFEVFDHCAKQIADEQKNVDKKIPTVDEKLFGNLYTPQIRNRYNQSYKKNNDFKKVRNYLVKNDKNDKDGIKFKEVVPIVDVITAGTNVMSDPRMSKVLNDLAVNDKIQELHTSIEILTRVNTGGGTYIQKKIRQITEKCPELKPFYSLLETMFREQMNLSSNVRDEFTMDPEKYDARKDDYDPNSFLVKVYKIIKYAVLPYFVYIYGYKIYLNSQIVANSKAAVRVTPKSIKSRLFNVATLNTFKAKSPKLVTYFEALKRSSYIIYGTISLFIGHICFRFQTQLNALSTTTEQTKAEYAFKVAATSTIATALSIKKTIECELGRGRIPAGVATLRGDCAILDKNNLAEMKRAAHDYCKPDSPHAKFVALIDLESK